jgi:hypothetical protein
MDMETDRQVSKAFDSLFHHGGDIVLTNVQVSDIVSPRAFTGNTRQVALNQ